MNRLEKIARSDKLDGKRIVVTGCGYKPLDHVFYDIVTGEHSQDSININEQEMKLNIGAATAGVLALNGATVHMVSTSPKKLGHIKEKLSEITQNTSLIEFSALDLLDKREVQQFVRNLPSDMPFYWVQSIGLGAGAYKVKDNNPYLRIKDIPIELIEKESGIVLRGTHLLMQEFLPRFEKQDETRIVIVSSMSAIRGYNRGGTHCAAKGAISRYTNSAMLDLWKDNIFITDIRPGVIDTGLYDSAAVQEAVANLAADYGDTYHKNFQAAPPTSVGEAINYVLTTSAHIPSLNLVARGQFPNEGS